MNDHTYVAIMAGGVGSRFWPASREARPKQFLDILGVGKSLLRLTFERFLALTPADHIFIVTNGRYAAQVKEQLPELSDAQILCEPSRNNTGPCVAYTAFKLHALDPAANLVVAPSDHLILQEAVFLQRLREALAFTAANDALVTLGIEPTRPDTGYGYIKYEVGNDRRKPRTDKGGRGRKAETTEGSPVPTKEVGGGNIYPVARFTEKPPLEQAKAFVAAGDYLWNAGIFAWRAAAVLEAFRNHAHEVYDILAGGEGKYNTPGEQAFIDAAYPTTPSISVDYAIMEHADNVYTIPSSFGWSDLGTWASLHAVADKDAAGNARLGGDALLESVGDSLIRLPKEKLLVAKELDGYIIVDEGDVLLIWPKSREQEIKAVTGKVREQWGERHL